MARGHRGPRRVSGKHDFIPSALMPAWISNETIQGSVPNADFNGLEVWGSYGSALIIKSYFVPQGYAAVVATDGPNGKRQPGWFPRAREPRLPRAAPYSRHRPISHSGIVFRQGRRRPAPGRGGHVPDQGVR